MACSRSGASSRDRRQVRQLARPSLEEADHQPVRAQSRLERIDEMEEERVQRDRQQRAGDDELEALRREKTERQAEGAHDERELADLGETGADRQRHPHRVAEQRDDRELDEGLGDDDEDDDRRDGQRHLDQGRRIEQHPDRHEEEDGERIAQRQGVGRGLVAHVGFADHRAGQERSEGERDAEHRRRQEGEPDRDGEHGQREQLLRALVRDEGQEARHETGAGDDHDDHEEGGLAERQGDVAEGAEAIGRCLVGPAEERRDRRQQDEDDDRHQVLDDQPADRDPALRRVELAAIGDRPEQDDRARDRQRQPEHQSPADPPAEGDAEHQPEQRRDDDLDERARDRDGADGGQVPEREVDAHPEHQQDDPDVGELERDLDVGDEAGGERAEQDAGHDVADDRRQSDPLGDEAADEGGHQADSDGRDEYGLVVHGSSRAIGWAQDWRGSVPERRLGWPSTIPDAPLGARADGAGTA